MSDIIRINKIEYKKIYNPYHLDRNKLYYLIINNDVCDLGYFREYTKQYILDQSDFIAKFGKQVIHEKHFNNIYEIYNHSQKEIRYNNKEQIYLKYEQIKNPYELNNNTEYFLIKNNKITNLGLFIIYYDQHYEFNINEKIACFKEHRIYQDDFFFIYKKIE